MSLEYIRPRNVEEALECLLSRTFKILAGGTDLVIQLREGRHKDLPILDISRLSELRFIREKDGKTVIGALTTLSDLLSSESLRRTAPVLLAAVREIGSVQIRNMGTIGTRFCQIVSLGRKGRTRTMPLPDFLLGPCKTVLESCELIHSVSFSTPPVYQHFEKLGERKAQAISIASTALVSGFKNGRLKGIRVALGSVAPTVIRAKQAEAFLESRPLTPDMILDAGEMAAQEASPISDVRATAAYRRKMVMAMVTRGLWPCLKEVGESR
ncbi:MAG: FAD binding domain-containing protein [Armatimonadetes bacterium]|nr:FAD binding domain-containing protein [Armatimonadota bacterium]